MIGSGAQEFVTVFFFLMEPMNPVPAREGRRLAGDASARASEETGVQVDRSCASSSRWVVEKIGKSGIPDKDSSSKTKSLSTKIRRKLLGGRQKQQNHSDKLTTMLGGMEMINGLAKAGAKAETKSTNKPTTVPTWNADAKL